MDVFLSDAHIVQALDAFVQKRSFLLTGDAGTGKTTLVNTFVKKSQDLKRKIVVTATTGIAAVNVNGRTIHSFLKIFPDDSTLTKDEIALRNGKNSYFCKTLQSLQTLVIDEASMLDIDLFEKIDYVLKWCRRNMAPFGGVQLILVGDFFQLPPVRRDRSDGLKFIFQMPLFYELERMELHTIFRQDEPAFSSLLRRMRRGELRAEDLQILESRLNAEVSISGIEPTKLFSRNLDVDTFNSKKLAELSGDERIFTSSSTATVLPECKKEELVRIAHDKFDKDNNIGPLTLKEGAQVLLTYNLDLAKGLCNGSRGVVVGFVEAGPLVRFLDPKRKPFDRLIEAVPISRIDRDLKVEFTANAWVPLKLAWATTIHKSQGLSLDCVEIALDESIFEEGQAYVAVSRARTLDGLSFSAFKPGVIRTNSDVKAFYGTPLRVLRDQYTP